MIPTVLSIQRNWVFAPSLSQWNFNNASIMKNQGTATAWDWLGSVKESKFFMQVRRIEEVEVPKVTVPREI